MRRLNLPGNSLTFRPILEPVSNDEQSILFSNFISHNTSLRLAPGRAKHAVTRHTGRCLSTSVLFWKKKTIYKHNNDFKRTKTTGNLRFKVIMIEVCGNVL